MLARRLADNQRIAREIEEGDEALQMFAQRSKEDSEMTSQDSIPHHPQLALSDDALSQTG